VHHAHVMAHLLELTTEPRQLRARIVLARAQLALAGAPRSS
jgi:hypothetical protein